MPELPDVYVYVDRLQEFLQGKAPQGVRLIHPFVLRTTEPTLDTVVGQQVTDVRRIGKRIVIGFASELFLVIHLMIAGRLRWREPGALISRRLALFALKFSHGTLFLTEASKKRRAAVHLVRGELSLQQFDRGGMEVFHVNGAEFAQRLRANNHTLKRALTDPRIVSGIGNAYSDEILHWAKLSPFRQTRQLEQHEIERLYAACQTVLGKWIERLRGQVGDGFPDKVTAFHQDMAVHGKYNKPCPECGAPIQRIVYAQNEANYCAQCQTNGKILADRALSRLLKRDWPRTLEELAQLPPYQ